MPSAATSVFSLQPSLGENPPSRNLKLSAGWAYPLGTSWDGKGVNFAVFSAHASKVELCLFDATGKDELQRIELPEYTDEIWHGHVSELMPGTVYGYRVHGIYAPDRGHRFNANKLLLDPYARSYVGSLYWDDACFGYTVGAEERDLSFDERDSAPFVPKSLVVDPGFRWRTQTRRRQSSMGDAVIYELHVKGFTKRHPAVPKAKRGTFAGLSHRRIVEYVKSLGVTCIELLPVFASVDERSLIEKGLTNYWGYNTIGFFAPNPKLSSDPHNSLREFKEMVARFHDTGLEVILDVAYNHTAEGNELGPTVSFRGIDNVSYYRLINENRRFYVNDTGTGNTLNLSHPRVIQMVMDSLRYWYEEGQVDGFRFDLGTILAREHDGFSQQSGFLKACDQDPLLTTAKRIAEPWDCGPGGYQVGEFPPGWTEWNDKFRDTVRSYWKGDSSVSEFVKRLCASADVFAHHGRRPWASLNFVTAHDGFTLNDLVSYNEKHNERNGEDNQDGTTANHSWNCGVEGPSKDPEILHLRQRQIQNILATLFLAQGIPMLTAGDEFRRTQEGNNNSYCQDNEINWITWSLLEKNTATVAFVKSLIHLRRRYPILRRTRFLTGDSSGKSKTKDVLWVHPSGMEMNEEMWNDKSLRCIGMLLSETMPAIVHENEKRSTLLLVFNSNHESIDFSLPDQSEPGQWELILSSAENKTQNTLVTGGGSFRIAERSVNVFVWLSLVNGENPAADSSTQFQS